MKTDFYTVELRIESELLNPSLVSTEMELTPSIVRMQGQTLGKKNYKKSLWGYSGNKTSVENEWISLEDGLWHVIGSVNSKRGVIKKYIQEFDVYWWCGHFQSSFDGGPKISAKIMKELGEFGAPLILSNYFFEEPSTKE